MRFGTSGIISLGTEHKGPPQISVERCVAASFGHFSDADVLEISIGFFAVSVYPACTSVERIRCFCRFSRLIESVTYALSTSLLVRSPPPLPILTETKTFTPLSQQFEAQSAIEFLR